MSYKVLLPLDGSPLSESVFPLLRLLSSREPELEVELLRTFEPPGTIYVLPDLAIPAGNPFSNDHLAEIVLKYLKDKTEELGDLKVSAELALGAPADEILERSENADLVLMASHGRGGLGRWLLGSVATKVLRGLTVPVLLLTGEYLQGDQFLAPKVKTILVALDGSEPAERALAHAAKWAKEFEARLVLYQAVPQVSTLDTAYLEANRQHLVEAEEYLLKLTRNLSGEVERIVRGTTTSLGIVDQALEVGADLIALGSHGKSGLSRWMLGSVTEQVLQKAPCPVLVTH